MSIMANDRIISTLRERFGDMLTCRQMEDVLQTVADVIADYDIHEIVREDQDNDMLLDVYISALRVEGRSEKTLNLYRYQLGRFLKASGCTSSKITAYHVRKYLSDEKARGINDSTIKNYCWIFGSYFGWLLRDGLIQRDPMANIGHVKVPKRVKEVFSEVDIERLKSGCKTIRDRAIVLFLKSTGCRISEMTALNRDSIVQNGQGVLECKVLGKGNKERIVYLNAVAWMVLQQYLETRADDNPALFVGLRGERLQPDGVRFMLRELGKRTGVKHVHPHKFRRTEITELVNRGMPIEQVATLMGHEKLDTTMGYIVTNQFNVRNSYQKYA